MSWRQITAGLTKPSRTKARIISQTLPRFHHGIGSPTASTADPLALTNPPRINLGHPSHGTRRHSTTYPILITLLNPAKRRSIRTTADGEGESPRTLNFMGASAFGCAAAFSALALFVAAAHLRLRNLTHFGGFGVSAAVGREGVGAKIEEGSEGINNPIGLSCAVHDVSGLCGSYMPSFNQCRQTRSLTGERKGGEETQSPAEGSG